MNACQLLRSNGETYTKKSHRWWQDDREKAEREPPPGFQSPEPGAGQLFKAAYVLECEAWLHRLLASDGEPGSEYESSEAERLEALAHLAAITACREALEPSGQFQPRSGRRARGQDQRCFVGLLEGVAENCSRAKAA